MTQTIKMVFAAHGKLPAASWLAKTAKVDLAVAQKALDDWQTTEGAFQQVPEATTEPPETETETDNAHHIHGIPMVAVKWIALVLAIMATVRAIFYASGWFTGSDNVILSWIMSVLIVGVTVIMPQMAVVLWRTNARGLSVIAFILTGVIMAFSMLMTIAGIYNDRTQKTAVDRASSVQTAKDNGQYQGFLDQQKILESRIGSAVKELNRLQGVLEKLDITDKNYQTIQARLDRADRLVDTIRGELLNLQAKLQKSGLGEDTAPRPDFFQWLSGVIGLSVPTIEFFSAIIPAVVIDIAAPILLFIVFFI